MTEWDTIGFLVLGLVPIALVLVIAILMDRVGGPANLYAPLFILALAAMGFYIGMYELFISTLVMLFYAVAYAVILLYFCIMKSYASQKGALR